MVVSSVNGKTLYAGTRANPYSALGTVVDTTDIHVAMEAAGLANWNVRQEDMSDKFPDYTWLAAQRFANVADIEGETRVLGTSGSRYGVMQNEEVIETVGEVADGWKVASAGAAKGGQVVFLQFEAEDQMNVGGQDPVSKFLTLSTTHDGTGNIMVFFSGLRLFCENQLNAAMDGVSNIVKVRHTATAKDRLVQAMRIWRQEESYFQAFDAEAQRLFEQSVTDKEFFGLVERMFPKPDADVKGSFSKWETKQALHAEAWNHSTNANIRNTAWGVANVLTEVDQWGRGIRQDDNGEERFNLAGAGFNDQTNKFRQRAFSLAASL